MAVSKRTRYEVLRRDDFACRYCGARAPEASLTVDHVMPVALGGTDDPTNLVTACRDCNAGKASTAPDAPIVADVDRDALRWAKAMTAAQEIMAQRLSEDHEVVAAFAEVWEKYGAYDLPDGWDQSVIRFYRAGLTIDVIKDSAFIATGARHVSWGYRFRYFCGICNARIRELQDTAKALVDSDEVLD